MVVIFSEFFFYIYMAGTWIYLQKMGFDYIYSLRLAFFHLLYYKGFYFNIYVFFTGWEYYIIYSYILNHYVHNLKLLEGYACFLVFRNALSSQGTHSRWVGVPMSSIWQQIGYSEKHELFT